MATPSKNSTSSPAACSAESSVHLQEVRLVAATDDLPQEASRWPVQVVRSSELTSSARAVYLCGSTSSIEPLLAKLVDPPLGLFLDEPPTFRTGSVPVEIVPGLSEGFAAPIWEDLVSRICSRHLETIQEMILRHAHATPDKAMIVFEENEWSFRESISGALSLCDELANRGYHPEGGPIAVQLEQSDLAMFVFLGLMSGGYVIHLVDGHASTRAYKLGALKSQVLICTSSAQPPGDIIPVFHVDEIALDKTRPLSELQVGGCLEDTAHVEYTSGSTGKPKAVATKQWRLSHWVRWREFHFPLSENNDRVAVNLFFIWYWHVPPCCGGTAVVYPNKLNHDMAELLKYIDQHKCQKIESITPGLIQAILGLELEIPKSVKIVCSGGEALPLSTCREWLKRFPDVALFNNLATTETASDICFCRVTPEVAAMDQLFAPIADRMVCWNLKIDIHEEELIIKGWNVADAYLPPTVSDRFTISEDGASNVYRTGDRAEYRNGYLVMLGRKDNTVKVRGFRVDLGGIEGTMDSCSAVRDIALVVFREAIWATVVTEDLEAVKRFAEENVQHHHLIVWKQWEKLPYTLSAKRDRQTIRKTLAEEFANVEDEEALEVTLARLPGGPPVNAKEWQVMKAWQKVLGRPVGREEQFAEAGGHSLHAMRLAKELGIQPMQVYMYPTIAAMAQFIQGGAELLPEADPQQQSPERLPLSMKVSSQVVNNDVAIVGMSRRFPGGIKSHQDLFEALKASQDLLSDVPGAGPNDVPRKGIVPDEGLDCSFWNIPESVAVLMDPTQRILLDLSYEALEDAGFQPFNAPGRVGATLSGSSLPHYPAEVLGVDLDSCRRERPDEYFQLEIGVDKDYLATLVAYHLNLHGPATTIGTACSSSLVVVVQACQPLRQQSCDYMLAGGASFSPDTPVRKVDGMIWSPDGICRPFAEGANGTVGSDGGGLIVLTRLDAALARGDWTFASIRGCGINNDGARKAGFSAPSHEGQTEVVRMAMSEAGATGDDYDYVEAHGTGTRLGDPIEVAALTRALATERKAVKLGSIKGNIGHLNTAAGICGLVKLAQMMWRQEMVPSLHAEKPTPLIDWASTPFSLAMEAQPQAIRVAGVSSFGIGGTNVHLTLGTSPSRGQEEKLTSDAFVIKTHSPFPSGEAAKVAAIPRQRGGTRSFMEARKRYIAQTGRASAKSTMASVNHSRQATYRKDSLLAQSPEHLFYETYYEKVDISCLQVSRAAVVLDGAALPKGLHLQHWALTTLSRAAEVAGTTGTLLYVGTSDVGPADVDDTSQEELLIGIMSLISDLAKAKQKPKVFFILKKSVRYSGIWSVLRCSAKEHPELQLRRMMLVDEDAQVCFPALAAELELRRDGAYVQRMRRASPPKPDSGLISNGSCPHRWKCVLVTGGLRGLGLKVASWLVATGRAAKLVLMSRREPQGDAKEEVAALQANPTVKVIQHLCDVSSWKQVEGLPFDCDLVIHAAAAIRDCLILNWPKADAELIRPKVRGCLHLRKKFPGARFLGFSSTSGLLGAAGQATYAFTNTLLDAMMPSVQWGGWSEAGMAVDFDIRELPGERFCSLVAGMECLGHVLDAPEQKTPPVVLDCDWEAFRQNPTQFLPDDPLIAKLPAEEVVPCTSLVGVRSSLGARAHRWELVLGSGGGQAWGTPSAWSVCGQHIIEDANIFPGSGFITLAFEALHEVIGSSVEGFQLANVAFLRPLHLAAPRRLFTQLIQNSDSDTASLRFSSVALTGDGNEILHCTADYMGSSSSATAPQKATKKAPSHQEPMQPVTGLYDRFHAAGFHYGPAFQASAVLCNGSEASGTLPSLESRSFLAPPAALDAALQLASLVHAQGCRGVPQAIARVTLHSRAPWSSALATRDADARVDVALLGSGSEQVCSVEGLDLAVLSAAPQLSIRHRVLQPVELLDEDEQGRWLMEGTLAQTLALTCTTSKKEENHDAVVMAVQADTHEDVLRCREEAWQLAAREPCWVVALQAPYAEAAAAAAVEAGASALVGSIGDVRRVAARIASGPPRIIFAEPDGKAYLEEACAPQRGELELKKATPEDVFSVTVDPSQGIDGARCRETIRRSPGKGEVEIRASLWALNFRDVLVAVGAIPMEVSGHSLGLGGECFGEVAAVGADVSGFQVGDTVIALPPDGLGTYVTTDARWLSRAPAGLTAEEAVAGTAVYATAWLGLIWQARMSQGDRVLIHSAAGGVGLAAVHLCLRAGCEVYVTASTEEKRNYLLSLGVAAAFNSRNPAGFEAGILDATKGEGIDIVLNSLSGEAIPASLRLLRAFGRFVEIGKRDQYEGNALKLDHFLRSLTYTVAHLDVLMLECPHRGRKLLEEVWQDLPHLPRLPTKTYEIAELPQALDYFSKGVHIGKVLVSIRQPTQVWPAKISSVLGPRQDILTAGLREALGAGDGRGGAVCIPDLHDLPSAADLEGARLILAGCRSAASIAAKMCPEAQCVELPRWELSSSALDDWLQFQGRRLVAVEEGTEADAQMTNLQDWLMEVVAEMAGQDVDMEQSFDDAGLDSLSLISLARRLSSKLGRSITVVDLYDHPTPKQLLGVVMGAGAPQPPVQRAKVLCLHGFRSNKDALAQQLAPFLRAVAGRFEWLLVNSPRRATGPVAPGIEAGEAYEWWGQRGGPFETAWTADHDEGFQESLAHLRHEAVQGFIGFSQGGGMAAALALPQAGVWCALFSAILPPAFSAQSSSTPSFHTWDPNEECVAECREIHDRCSSAELHLHHRGHDVPDEAELVQHFAAFVAAR